MDKIAVSEAWDSMKEFIKEKDRAHLIKNVLVILEEHGVLSEADFEYLLHEDKYFEEAVRSVYKDLGEEFEDDMQDDEETHGWEE